jgi:hypothetical protein
VSGVDAILWRRLDKAMRESLNRNDRLDKEVAAMNRKIQLIEYDGVGHMPQVEIFDRYIDDPKNFIDGE